MSLLKSPHEEARARIIWGESPAEVHHWLVMEAGLTEEQAEVLVRSIKKERARDIRYSGIRSARTGLLFIIGGIIPLVVMWSASFVVRIVFVLAVGLVVYGIYKVLRGVSHLIAGSAKGSLTEMD